jgi:hypothetical protein
LVGEAYHRPLKAADMLELQDELKSESTAPIFENAWRDEVERLKKLVCKTFSLILIQSESIIHGYVIFYSFSIAANVK